MDHEGSAVVRDGKDQRGKRTFGERLDFLMRTVRPAGRDEYTHEEVAHAIAAKGGPTISTSYVWQLRTGKKDNPTKKHIEALANFFGVPASYFFDDEAADRIASELDLLAAMRDNGVRRVALRSTGLSSESLAALTTMVEQARRLEGLPEQEEG
jgi:transcriptional regulator with XRE-family HTH domain